MSRMMSSGSMSAWRAAAETPDYDPADVVPEWRVFRHTYHTSRKDLPCACGHTIPAGARYEQVVGTEDGKFTILRHCPVGKCPALAQDSA